MSLLEKNQDKVSEESLELFRSFNSNEKINFLVKSFRNFSIDIEKKKELFKHLSHSEKSEFFTKARLGEDGEKDLLNYCGIEDLNKFNEGTI